MESRSAVVINMSRRIIFLISILIGAQSNPAPDDKPCKEDDNICVTKITNTLIAMSITGNPELNIEKLDPMYLGNIVGDLGEIKYELRNTTTEGLKDCVVASTKVLLAHLKIEINIHCPYVYMHGQYQISGQLLTMPVEGDGDYSIKLKDYDISLIIDKIITKGKDGQEHMSVTSFTVTGDLKGGATLDATNLFNGQKELADNLMNFANRNPKPVFKVLQDPPLKASTKKLVKNLNKTLQNIPSDKIVKE